MHVSEKVDSQLKSQSPAEKLKLIRPCGIELI
jgi:hypothetical protein